MQLLSFLPKLRKTSCDFMLIIIVKQYSLCNHDSCDKCEIKKIIIVQLLYGTLFRDNNMINTEIIVFRQLGLGGGGADAIQWWENITKY